MPHVLLDNAPADAAIRLHEHTGDELLSFFKSLPWDGFLASFLVEQTNDVLKHLLGNLISAMGDEGAGQAVLPLGETGNHELLSELQSVYLVRSSAIDSLGLKCDELPTGAARPSKFHTGSNRGGLASKQLQAFWSAFVTEDSTDGFMGRAYKDDTNERRTRFRSIWNKDALESLDSLDVKRLATFLAYEGQAVSPSAASCRKMLERCLLNDVSDGPTGVVPSFNLTVPVPPSSQPQCDSRPQPTSKKSPHAARIRKQPAVARRRVTDKDIVETDSDSEGSSDPSFVSDDSPDEDFIGQSRTRRNSKFPGLPRKMVQVLEQGGKEFEELFEPLRVDITTPKDLYRLLKYFNDGQRVTRELCRASGLTVDPNLCVEKLEVGRIYRIRPDHCLADTLSFDPTSRRAPRILHRWISHGSIIPWLNALCARAGQVEKDNADGYLAREIMSAGLTLASLLNEFHPAHLLYSSAVKRLVRRLWVIEKALSMERQQRGQYLTQMLGFMGIGQGPITEPEELK